MLILGFDPGVKNLGYSIYSTDTKKVIKSSEIIASAPALEDKLVEVYHQFNKLLDSYDIKVLSYEQPVFIGRGVTGEQINRVLGVVLLLANLRQIKFANYTAPSLKKRVTGNGRADKKEVAKFVSKYFNIDNQFSTTHAADSLGAIMCYLLEQQTNPEL